MNVMGGCHGCHGGGDIDVAIISKGELSKETTNTAAPAAAVFPCLDKMEIPQSDKIWLSKMYPEKVILNAIKWANHPTTKIKKSLAAALKWACHAEPKVVNEVDTEDNNRIAKFLEAKLIENKSLKDLFYFVSSPKGVEIGYKVGGVIPVEVKYSSPTFKEDLYKAMQRFQIKKPKGFDVPNM